jgi:hypothetical protein
MTAELSDERSTLASAYLVSVSVCTVFGWLTQHVMAEFSDERNTLGSACLVNADTIAEIGLVADTAFGPWGGLYP